MRGLFGARGGSPAVIASLRHQYGLGLAILVQNYHYMKDMILHFDFGTQIASWPPVTDVLGEAFPVTLRWRAGLRHRVGPGSDPGRRAGMRAGRFADNAILLVSLLLISVPVFVLGFILKVVFAFQLNWLPPNANDSTNYNELADAGVRPRDRLTGRRHPGSPVRRSPRTCAPTTSVRPSPGLPRRRVVGVHLMRNSLIPVITYLGTDIGALMGGAVVTEGLFNIQGIGGTIYQSIVRREGTTLVGLVTILVLVYLLASLLVDLLYAVLDPRIRYA